MMMLQLTFRAKPKRRSEQTNDCYRVPIEQRRDFIGLLSENGLDYIAYEILSFLDMKSLCRAEQACKAWQKAIANGGFWRRLIERNVRASKLWRGITYRRGWQRYIFQPRNEILKSVLNEWKMQALSSAPEITCVNAWERSMLMHSCYRRLYLAVLKDIEALEKNWTDGTHTLSAIVCQSEISKGIYCMQYDEEKIVGGSRDMTIKMWDWTTKQCLRTYVGHEGSVLCLQYDDELLVSGSSDCTVRVWDIETGEVLSKLVYHTEPVLSLRFSDELLLTCSRDHTIVMWNMNDPRDITRIRVLLGHGAAVNVVNFDKRYIVSASGDRSIKIWSTQTGNFVRTLKGHSRGIACLQYRDALCVSGSSDNTIRVWQVETGHCVRVLEGHEKLVRCVSFDNKRIVSGDYEGAFKCLVEVEYFCRRIKVWDLKAVLDPNSQDETLCLCTLVFDEFKIVSSSHDDTILIWDFLGKEVPVKQVLSIVRD